MADVMSAPLELSQYQNTQQSSQDADGKLRMLPPPPTNHSSTTPNSASARRPPRKSTLTQQQKNQKRQRATQDQLMTLEVEFNKNPTPTALVRERIAQDINMTERSVQIWFQNRRAKIKNIAKRSIENGDEYDSIPIPDTMRQYLMMQAYGAGGKGLGASFLGRAGPMLSAHGGSLCLNPEASSNKLVIQHFSCRSLSIGSWRRVGQSTMDLIIFYAPDKACITYYINNDQAGYKIEYPFSSIRNISLEQGDVLAAAEGASQRSGGLIIELIQPPKFYMDSSGLGGFYECGDFTEDQQASQVMVHQLGGPSKVLSGQLAKLVSLDAYQNRHLSLSLNTFAVSAPVTPMRPASQPNHLVHPHHAVNMFPQDSAIGLMGPPAARGHKRQRSRSVPAAIDFSMLRHPMPSFLIQHDEHPAQPPPMPSPAIFAPVPQHGHSTTFVPGPAPHNLTIDTTGGYGMGMQYAGPLSATTANSPSEYGTPAFVTAASSGDTMPNTQFGTPFNNGFLSVDPAAMIGTSNTPISSHGDPFIADSSPPMHGMGRSQSADIFGTPGEHSQFGDDSLYLSESFNQKLALPFRSPLPEETFHSPLPDGSFNFQTPPGTSDSQLSIPMHNQQFDCPPPQTQDGSTMFQSPPHYMHSTQQHQDSAVSFSTPSHNRGSLFNTPKDSGMVYQDSKMYASPGQLQHLADEHNIYQNSPLANASTGQGIDLHHLGMYGTIDPHNLGRPQQ